MAAPNNVHADAVVVAVASASASDYSVEGIAIEVAWQDRVPEVRVEPRAFLLFQDPALRGSSAITSATSQQGPHVATAFANAGNEGDLLPFATGVWDTDPGTPDPEPDDLLLRIVRTGSLYDSAEWAYRIDRHAGSTWVGMDDLRWQHRPENPTDQQLLLSGSPAIVHSTVHQRTIVAWAAGGSLLRVRYRALGAASWTEVVLDVTQARTPSPLMGLELVELPDGALRLFYLYGAPTYAGTERELDVWGSTDGGASWELVKERVISDVLGAPDDVRDVKVARSGDWLRLELWLQASPAGIVSACSSDRCATWQVVLDAPDGTDAGTGDATRAWAFDLAAVDEQGTFLRVRRTTSSVLLYELATRDSGWASIEQTLSGGFSAPSANVRGIWCAAGAGRTFTLVLYDDGAGVAGWSVGSFIIPSSRIAQGWDLSANARSGWARWGFTDWLAWQGGARYTPKDGRLCWAGDRLLLFTLQRDRAGTLWGGFSLTQFGGPSQRPLRLPMNTHTDATRLWRVSWNTALGTPVGPAASAYTPWTGSSGGTFTVTAYPERMDAEVTSGGQVAWRESTSLGSITRHLGDDGVVQWVTAAMPGGRGLDDTRPASMAASELTNPRWGARAQGGSRHAGLSMQVAVHLWADGGFALYDVSAGSTLYAGAAGTLAGITLGEPYEFRMALAETDVVERAGAALQFVELSWARHQDGASWASSGLHTLASDVLFSGNVELVEFGVCQAVAADHDTSWWECAYASGSSGGGQDHLLGSLAQIPFANPGIMRGFDCIPFGQVAAQGAAVRWGGAGGFEGDLFRVPIAWEQGAEQLLGSSPAVVWSSTTGATQQLVLDAEQVGGAGWRWQHSAIALLGGNARRYEVEYAEDSAFTTPSRFWLDGLRAEVQLAAPLGGKLYRITGAALAGWRDGELVDWHLHAAGATRTAQVEHNAGDVLRLRLDGTEADHGLVAGATLQLWAPDQLHRFLDYPLGVQVRSATAGLTSVFPRFMRVTIEADTTAGRPYGGSWQLGRLQAGLTLPITVPMDWSTQDDDEDPNVDLQTVASGKRAAYRRGPPRRTLQGTSRGDVDRWRIAFRSTVRTLAGYSEHPVVLCTDDQQLHLRSLYARLTSSTELANAGWRYNRTTGRWEQVGDLRMTFQQEV